MEQIAVNINIVSSRWISTVESKGTVIFVVSFDFLSRRRNQLLKYHRWSLRMRKWLIISKKFEDFTDKRVIRQKFVWPEFTSLIDLRHCVILKILNNSTNFEQFMFVMIGSIASNSNWFFVLLFDRSNWQNQLVWRERTWKMLISWNVKIAYFIHFNTFVSVRNDVFVTKWKLRSSTRYCVHAFFIILNHTKRTDDTGLAILSILEVVYDKPLWTT